MHMWITLLYTHTLHSEAECNQIWDSRQSWWGQQGHTVWDTLCCCLMLTARCVCVQHHSSRVNKDVQHGLSCDACPDLASDADCHIFPVFRTTMPAATKGHNMACAVLHAQVCFLILSAILIGVQDNYAHVSKDQQSGPRCYACPDVVFVANCNSFLVFRTTMAGAMRKQCRE